MKRRKKNFRTYHEQKSNKVIRKLDFKINGCFSQEQLHLSHWSRSRKKIDSTMPSHEIWRNSHIILDPLSLINVNPLIGSTLWPMTGFQHFFGLFCLHFCFSFHRIFPVSGKVGIRELQILLNVVELSGIYQDIKLLSPSGLVCKGPLLCRSLIAGS